MNLHRRVSLISRVAVLALSAAVAACQSTPAEVAAPAPVNCPPIPAPVVCPPPAPPPSCPVLPPPAPAPVCPPPPVCPTPTPTSGEIDGKLLIGEVEFFTVQPGNLRLEARIDTGATTSSIHAVDAENFERDGKPWVRFKSGTPGKPLETLELPWTRHVRIKGEDDDFQRRQVVMIEVTVDGHRRRIEATLNNRSNYAYPLLIGRNFLRDNCIVDVSRKHVLGKK